jgi:hypothetical protein
MDNVATTLNDIQTEIERLQYERGMADGILHSDMIHDLIVRYLDISFDYREKACREHPNSGEYYDPDGELVVE